ncbi:carboxymuconolactone decarboxylase family protein [Anaerovibrio sp.]|uniref:carboxymuconolactone decarboxylase family protein n=1 Tax=Anaerovibrio sp. TaxID=1872532 RepID=UPI003F73AA58
MAGMWRKRVLPLLAAVAVLAGSSRAWAAEADKADGGMEMKKIVQTAGRNALGDFAPEFAHYNDDVLFGENWNNEDIDLKTRSMITVVALMSSGITDSSLKYHLENAKNHGVTQKEIAAVITHVAFYAGWPKAWAVFNMAKEVWAADE